MNDIAVPTETETSQPRRLRLTKGQSKVLEIAIGRLLKDCAEISQEFHLSQEDCRFVAELLEGELQG